VSFLWTTPSVSWESNGTQARKEKHAIISDYKFNQRPLIIILFYKMAQTLTFRHVFPIFRAPGKIEKRVFKVEKQNLASLGQRYRGLRWEIYRWNAFPCALIRVTYLKGYTGSGRQWRAGDFFLRSGHRADWPARPILLVTERIISLVSDFDVVSWSPSLKNLTETSVCLGK